MKDGLEKERSPATSQAMKLKILDELRTFAVGTGASGAVVMDIDEIVIREQVRLKCRVPLCKSYNRNLMCPPNVMEPEEFKKVLECYSKAILMQKEGRVEPGQEEDRAVIFKPANELHQMVNEVEREAYRKGFRFAAGFIGGSCKLCDECVTVGSGLPCKYPFKARPSMEAMGIDVFDTAGGAGLPFSIPMGDSVVWCGLVLVY